MNGPDLGSAVPFWTRLHPPVTDDDIRRTAHAIWDAKGRPTSGSEQSDWDAAATYLRRTRPRIVLSLAISVLLAIVGIFLFVFQILAVPEGIPGSQDASHSPTPQPATSQPATSQPSTAATMPTTMPDFLLYDSDRSVPPARWTREKAVEFGLNQLSARLQSALLGAAAIFWFAIKLLLDGSPADKKPKGMWTWSALLYFDVLLCCSLSILIGFLGLYYFAEFATALAASVSAEVSVCAMYQLVTLFFGAILLLAGVLVARRAA